MHSTTTHQNLSKLFASFLMSLTKKKRTADFFETDGKDTYILPLAPNVFGGFWFTKVGKTCGLLL